MSSQNTVTPNDFIAATSVQMRRNIIQAMARQLESVNPLLSNFANTVLDPDNPEHVSAFTDNVNEVLPVQRVFDKLERNLNNTTEPGPRPDNFGITVKQNESVKNAQEQDNTLDYSVTRGM